MPYKKQNEEKKYRKTHSKKEKKTCLLLCLLWKERKGFATKSHLVRLSSHQFLEDTRTQIVITLSIEPLCSTKPSALRLHAKICPLLKHLRSSGGLLHLSIHLLRQLLVAAFERNVSVDSFPDKTAESNFQETFQHFFWSKVRAKSTAKFQKKHDEGFPNVSSGFQWLTPSPLPPSVSARSSRARRSSVSSRAVVWSLDKDGANHLWSPLIRSSLS